MLVSIENIKLLIDPMLGPIASPVSFARFKRYPYSDDIMLNLIEQMPPIETKTDELQKSKQTLVADRLQTC